MSAAFVALYLLVGMSDMLDGFLARKLHAESTFGKRLDSIADAVFILISLTILLPYFQLPLFVYLWCLGIICLKLAALYFHVRIERFFGFSAAWTNKITGGILFISPLTACVSPATGVAVFVCVIATASAAAEIRNTRKI